jgi:transcriptional regulator with XRE-family HTH domain
MPSAERARSFDAEGFFDDLDAVRESRKSSWRKVAEEAGVSASTLTRMSQGRRPDVDSFAALTSWADLDPDDYLVTRAETKDALSEISVLLRRDPKLSDEAASAIDELIRATYNRLQAQ